MGTGVPSYKGFRFPVEIISHCVWLYYRFPLSFREVEEMMMERGIIVSYETIRGWCRKFNQDHPEPRDTIVTLDTQQLDSAGWTAHRRRG